MTPLPSKNDPAARATLDSHVYYFVIGAGDWAGDFKLRITDWRKLRRASIGLKNLFLVTGMHLTLSLFGKARIVSTVTAMPEQGPVGEAANSVRISKLGVTLYLLAELYELDPDGTRVHVVSHERFGPVPFLFKVSKEAPARIKAGGMGAVYEIPLLGGDWIGDYTVRPDRDHIHARLECPWGSADEEVARMNLPSGARRTRDGSR
jgi:hypothetical protein